MSKISYSDEKSSEFVRIIKGRIENLDKTIDEQIDLPSTSKGYSGKFITEINESADFFIVENFKNKDISRFPQRIKAAATALQLTVHIGKYFISHKEGKIRIVTFGNELQRRLNLWEKIKLESSMENSCTS